LALALTKKEEEIARLLGVIHQRDEQIRELAQERERLRSDFARLQQDAQEKIGKVMERLRDLNQRLMDRGETGGAQKSGTYR